MDRLCQFEETGNIVVMVNAQLCRSIGAFRRIYTCILYHDKTSAAFGTLLVIINMKEAHLAVLLTVICAYRCHHDPVFDSHAAYSKRFK